MTALILALIALGTLLGLIVRAAKHAPQEYVDLMIMTEERHAKRRMTMNNTYTFIIIAVYLGTVAITYYTLYKRFTDTLTEIETNYRLSLSRACTAFVDAMNAVSKALDTDTEPEPEQTELSELSERQTE